MKSYHQNIKFFIRGIVGMLIIAGLLLGIMIYIEHNDSRVLVTENKVFCGVADSSKEFTIGKEIFIDNCASCHKLDSYATGPSLRGVDSVMLSNWMFVIPKRKDIAKYSRMYHYGEYHKLLDEMEVEQLRLYLVEPKI